MPLHFWNNVEDILLITTDDQEDVVNIISIITRKSTMIQLHFSVWANLVDL